jgi:hypothetical protein
VTEVRFAFNRYPNFDIGDQFAIHVRGDLTSRRRYPYQGTYASEARLLILSLQLARPTYTCVYLCARVASLSS